MPESRAAATPPPRAAGATHIEMISAPAAATSVCGSTGTPLAMPTGSASTTRDQVVGAGEAQPSSPPVLAVTVALPVGEHRPERVGRLRQRGQAQRAPQAPVLGVDDPQLDHDADDGAAERTIR